VKSCEKKGAYTPERVQGDGPRAIPTHECEDGMDRFDAQDFLATRIEVARRSRLSYYGTKYRSAR